MINKTIHLKEYYPILKNDPILISYAPSNFETWTIGRKRKCLIIFPGGGYQFVSNREAEPVALKFMSEDIACFVLFYSVMPKMNYPEPFIEGFAAVAYIKNHFEEYNVDPNSISVLGFSAGGHLASMLGAYYQDDYFSDYLSEKKENLKIDAVLLGYPVISSTYGHKETIESVSKNDPELLDKLSIDKHVSKDYPKTFIWTTSCDELVDVANSLLLAESLNKVKVPFELHIYPFGGHGGATCDELSYNKEMVDEKTLEKIKYNSDWIKCAVRFIKNL